MSDCLFCRIIDKAIPADIVLERGNLLALRDINPQAPTHVLIIPRRHIATIDDLQAEDTLLVGEMVQAAREIAAAESLVVGYRLVFNCGRQGGQEVDHLHLHLLGGRSMEWPPG
ncbi:MAG: histidine triad nucleotide-binding protein [Candidatus Delongbacteria bacterium]|nr:histidine triad nucleotide-binding protein [Candidatus Delongbacteria bacterium]